MAPTKRRRTGSATSVKNGRRVSRSRPKECDVVNIPYFTNETDVKKIGPSVAVCTALLDQIGQEEMLSVIRKFGKDFIESHKYSNLPKKERERLEKQKAECPAHFGGRTLGGYCICGMDVPKYQKAQPVPGTIGVGLNQIAFHTNVPNNYQLPPVDPCVLKLGKVGDTQCITIQYDFKGHDKVCLPSSYERQVQVRPEDIDSEVPKKKGGKKKKKGKGKGKKKGKGKGKGKGKSKGKSKKGKVKSKKRK